MIYRIGYISSYVQDRLSSFPIHPAEVARYILIKGKMNARNIGTALWKVEREAPELEVTVIIRHRSYTEEAE